MYIFREQDIGYATLTNRLKHIMPLQKLNDGFLLPCLMVDKFKHLRNNSIIEFETDNKDLGRKKGEEETCWRSTHLRSNDLALTKVILQTQLQKIIANSLH